jgi:hypothetical protein
MLATQVVHLRAYSAVRLLERNQKPYLRVRLLVADNPMQNRVRNNNKVKVRNNNKVKVRNNNKVKNPALAKNGLERGTLRS